MSLTAEGAAELGPNSTVVASKLSSALPLLASTLDHLKSSASNASSLLDPSLMDLLLVVPRIVLRAGTFALVTIPERIDSIVLRDMAGTVIAGAAGGEDAQPVIDAAASEPSGTALATLAVGGVFSYLTSKWALTCFTVAIILNRTQVYASSRRHIHLGWSLRLALRIMPIVMFLYQTQSLLQAMRCQTSPEFSSLRYGKPGKGFVLDFAAEDGLLHYLSSGLLFWQSDKESCYAAGMVPQPGKTHPTQGSLSLLWPLFQTLCLSQFIETLSCALQGRQVMTETGMPILEHSLAFAEAEAKVGNRLGFGPFGSSNLNLMKNVTEIAKATSSDSPVSLTKASMLERVNTPPEVLLIASISALNNLSSNILGVLGLQSKFRLIHTGFWALCFMSALLWGLFTFSPETTGNAGILRFPTVCILGFIPHLLILQGICVCGFIYVLALTLTAISPPAGLPRPRSLKERFAIAHENLQANVQLSSIRVSMHEDFYTALLKVGFTALTVASEAVYLNEGRRIGVARWTWLEEERMQEFEQSRTSLLVGGASRSPTSDTDDLVAVGGDLRSPYARERTTKVLRGRHRSADARARGDGVGALQRGTRWLMAWDFFSGIFWLITGWLASGLDRLLDKAGLTRRPQWLGKVVGRSKFVDKGRVSSQAQGTHSLDFWLLSDEGELSLPKDDDVDVEAETKKRLQLASDAWGEEEERNLDSNLYGWWKHGGWWGERDESGDYRPPDKADDDDADDDTTSLISFATTTTTTNTDASESDWHTDGDDTDGRRTPTQLHPHPVRRRSRRSREPSTPPPVDTAALDPAHLARLLDPRSPDDRAEARLLAQHLSSDHALTRSAYRRQDALSRAHILTSSASASASVRRAPSRPGKPSAADEEQILEHLILSRRQQQQRRRRRPHHDHGSGADDPDTDAEPSSSWHTGSPGLGAAGPLCVVCQSAPRSILAWPCRCLAVCEDCRVSLAMTNFATCVCCRQAVAGFARLFVP